MDDWNHSIPYCRKVKVYAQEGPDTAPFINYLVPVKGTTEEGMSVAIQEQLQTPGVILAAADSKYSLFSAVDPVLQPAVQAPPDHDRSTAHLSLQESPRISVLLNKVAAEVPNKWEILGIQLEIDYDQLESISSRHQDNLLRFAAVFQLWKKSKSSSYTWTTIINALRSKLVGEVQLAYELEQWVMSTQTIPKTTSA